MKRANCSGLPVTTTYVDPFSGRTVFEVDDKLFAARNKIVVTL